MTQDEVADLVALVGSRLCHDLVSPLGAIGNGLELLAMAGGGADDEMQLVTESVAHANARLKFFRVAFGQAAGDQRLGHREIVALLDDIALGGRLSFDWQPEGDQARREVKLGFLAVLCLETALPWGGRIIISTAGGGWRLAAEARRTRPDPDLWARLDGGTAPLAPAQVQFGLLATEAARQGRRTGWQITATSAEITF